MKSTSRLVAADERGLPTTILIAGGLAAGFGFTLNACLSKTTWFYAFFFKRSFVQWVLISAFAVGLVHLLRRLPPWWRERKALKDLRTDCTKLASETLVGRRWCQIQEALKEIGYKNLGQYARSLAEHDEAEVDAAYRVSGDVVQILPLIGFFGTVFGLSHGLYKSFLTTGGTSAKDFAAAIAIAFDNTLLGLALTIILFATQSILRKREDGILLELNLDASDEVARAVQKTAKAPLQAAVEGLRETVASHETAIKQHGSELEKSRKLLESPSDGIKEVIQSHTTAVAKSVFQEVAALQKTEQDRIGKLVLSQLEEQAKKILELVEQRTTTLTQLPQLAKPVNEGLEALKTDVQVISKLAQSVSDQIATLAKNDNRSQLAELATALKSLGTVLADRDSSLLERLRALDETRTKLDAVAAEAHSTAQVVAGFGIKLDAVPEERRTVEQLAGSIRELASALAQRDSLMLTSIQGSLVAHSHDIKTEIRQPRTIKFIEAPHLTDGDGALPTQ